MRAPFPYFGGKFRAAHHILAAFGEIKNYVEPFAGSLAVLLVNPTPPKIETVNDMNCWITNFWRAVRSEPDDVAKWADWPVSELDLLARGNWLFCGPGTEEFRERMRSDPDYFDAKMAGWWVWGAGCSIGRGWGAQKEGNSSSRSLPHLGNTGIGINRVSRETSRKDYIDGIMAQLSERLRDVRICCGDWRRVCGPSPTFLNGLTGILLDPPYSHSEREKKSTPLKLTVRKACEIGALKMATTRY